MSQAWECAFVLVYEHADRLTVQQLIEAHVALLSAERAPLSMIALLADILGERQ